MKDISKYIIDQLPYEDPFLFVDAIDEVSENGIKGSYTFPKDSYFYKGHFKDHPVTPGVIITECMAQIGVAALGVYLLKDQLNSGLGVAMTSTDMDFYKPVYPGDQLVVVSEVKYFRFNKLKCEIKARNTEGVLVAKGTIAGMIKPWSNE